MLKTIFVAALLFFPLSSLSGRERNMDNAQKNAGCTKIWTAEAGVLSFFSNAGGHRQEVHIDLKFKKVATIITDFDESKPYKRVREQDLSAADALKLNAIMGPLCLEPSTAASGPPPGGSWYFEVRYLSPKGQTRAPTLSPRILSRKEGVTQATPYYALTESQAKALLDFIGAVAPPIK